MKESVPSSRSNSLEHNKLKAYQELCEGIPDSIFILARGIVEHDGKFKSGSYAHIDLHGNMDGAKARSIAAAELHRYFPSTIVAANSYIKIEPASYASVIASELEARNVPTEQIVTQEDSYSTFTELLELIKLIVAKQLNHVVVISNEYQMPRAEAMFEHLTELRDPQGYSQKPDVQGALKEFAKMSKIKVSFVTAEEILKRMDPRFANLIEEARKIPEWKATMERETAAAEQVRRGEYWKNLPSTAVTQ